ncbi:MAG TPA: cytoplasmic protein [Cellvibrio sp.]|nr:cytoplasmic protein [Cellvibrio sp.]
MNIDPAKVRRETIRWMILLTLQNARPVGAHENIVLTTIQAVFGDATPLEVRRELEYLKDRALVDLEKSPSGPWSADLTRYGVDVAEYTVDVEPGIARPAKYW